MKLKLIIVLLIYHFALFSQKNYIHYTPFDGLAQTQVTCLYQDYNGYLWIGTKGGLSRFDGYEFTNFYKKDGLDDISIKYIGEDKNNVLWVLTTNALNKYENGKFTAYKKENSVQFFNNENDMKISFQIIDKNSEEVSGTTVFVYIEKD